MATHELRNPGNLISKALIFQVHAFASQWYLLRMVERMLKKGEELEQDETSNQFGNLVQNLKREWVELQVLIDKMEQSTILYILAKFAKHIARNRVLIESSAKWREYIREEDWLFGVKRLKSEIEF